MVKKINVESFSTILEVELALVARTYNEIIGNVSTQYN